MAPLFVCHYNSFILSEKGINKNTWRMCKINIHHINENISMEMFDKTPEFVSTMTLQVNKM